MKLLFQLVLLTAFFAVASLFPSFAHAASPTFGPNLLVSDAISGSTSSIDGPPILDIDIAGGVYVAWIDHRGSQPGAGQTEVFFSKLTPDGIGFSTNKPLSGITNNIKSFPQIEVDAGNIYIAWYERRIINSRVQEGVYFTKSQDGGQTFSEEVFVDSISLLPTSMVAHDGKIIIAYSQFKELRLGATLAEVWIASSVDGGNTFTKSKVSDSILGVYPQRPVVDFTGNDVYVFWFDNRNSGRYQVFFAKSQDGGASFGTNQLVFSHPNSGIHLLGNSFGRLSARVSGQEVSLAFDFFLQTPNPFSTDFEVLFIKSTDGGANFSTAQRLSDDPISSKTRQQNPSLTLLPDGSPVVAWYDERDGADQRKIMLAYSQDQGDTFGANINITPNSGPFSAPTIVADSQGKIHFVRWDSLAPIGVYYTKIDLGLQLETTPTPFLDLPWDYQSKGFDFDDVALTVSSYFDHEYPLLSARLIEPMQVVNLFGIRGVFSYSSHDGYDYAKKALVNFGDSVLAAADGCASYHYNEASGNTIRINHNNGYQTRYLHLDTEELITKSANCTNVSRGQKIGLVGFTGNVKPQGIEGAHIHFMIIQDKNNDGNFDDNIPDGITDPFGWQSTEPDPWANYSFNYLGQNRTGDKSFYLWTKPIANLSDKLTSNGGFFKLKRYELDFPQGATNQDLTVSLRYAPAVKPTHSLQSIGPTLMATAKNAADQFVEEFTKAYTIRIDFSTFDLSTLNLATISIHSSEDGVNWVKEPTTVDLGNKKATAELNHFSHFALMAERLDTQAPTTTAILSGEQGNQNWFRSNVQITLNAQDNLGGLGVDYTPLRVNDEDWHEYTGPIDFTAEGDYTVEFYSIDIDENIEDKKSITFHIDKTIPEAKIFIDQNKQDLVVSGIDQNQTVVSWANNPTTKKKDDAIYTITDQAGNTLKLDVRDRDKEKQDRLKIFSVQYNNDPVISEPSNHFNVLYNGKKDKLNVKEQNFEIKDEVKIRIQYNQKKNQSTIITRQTGQEKVKEILPGLTLLQLVTNKGNLEYSY